MVKRDKTSGLDRNDRQTWSRLKHTLLIIKFCLLLIWVKSEDFVWNNVCIHVCKTTNWWFIIICNCIYIVVINCGWRMDGTVGGARDGDWAVRTSHFYGSHKGLWKSTATLCWLCAFYCDCFETYIAPYHEFQFWQYGTFKSSCFPGKGCTQSSAALTNAALNYIDQADQSP